MTDAEIWETVNISDLPEAYADMAGTIGMEPMIKLVKSYGGTNIYIPTLKSFAKEAIHRHIANEFDGGGIERLARKYGVSARTVYRILNRKIGR
jgi:Mor family transcriptional regulator